MAGSPPSVSAPSPHLAGRQQPHQLAPARCTDSVFTPSRRPARARGTEAKAELQRELGGDPALIDGLTEPEAAELLRLLHEGLAQQEEEVTGNIDHALRLMPPFLRRPVRKIMFPE